MLGKPLQLPQQNFARIIRYKRSVSKRTVKTKTHVNLRLQISSIVDQPFQQIRTSSGIWKDKYKSHRTPNKKWLVDHDCRGSTRYQTNGMVNSLLHEYFFRSHFWDIHRIKTSSMIELSFRLSISPWVNRYNSVAQIKWKHVSSTQIYFNYLEACIIWYLYSISCWRPILPFS